MLVVSPPQVASGRNETAEAKNSCPAIQLNRQKTANTKIFFDVTL
jgi:hypothetical protein